MDRTRWLFVAAFALLALLGVFPVAGEGPLALARAEVEVVVLVTVDGAPADALIRVLQEGDPVSVAYTDVHTPGRAAFALPPGDYTFQVEHGAGFTSRPQQHAISLEAGRPHTLEAAIARDINPRTRGYVSADLHAHTVASAPATVALFGISNHGTTPVDQAVGVQLAAGLDVVVISDHNTVGGHAAFAATAQARGVPYLLSEEITTTRWGHFNAYSLEAGGLVAFDFSKVPAQFFAEARDNGAEIIQVNHPLSAGGGYFFLKNDPQYDPGFDAVEAFNGVFGEDDAYTVLRLFEHWNAGRRYVATAVSDDHDWKDMDSEYGTPRTYVRVDGNATGAGYLKALQAGRAYLTYGPMVFFSTAGGATPGDTVSAGEGVPLQFALDIHGVDGLNGVRAELIRNGNILQSVALSGTAALLAFEDIPPHGAWYAVQLVAPSGRALALTNPIWTAP